MPTNFEFICIHSDISIHSLIGITRKIF